MKWTRSKSEIIEHSIGRIAVKEITEKLSGRAERWNRLLSDFNKEVNANENLD